MKYTYTLTELPEIVSMILGNITSKTILFHGEMGVGKTTLIKELAHKLGVQDTISSPTFSIVNEYALPKDKLYHFDFYRIKNDIEILDIGIEDYFDSDHWMLIEWPDKISEGLLPEKRTKLNLIKNTNGSRTIHIEPVN